MKHDQKTQNKNTIKPSKQPTKTKQIQKTKPKPQKQSPKEASPPKQAGFATVTQDNRLKLLYTFLLRQQNKQIVVFLCSSEQVLYFQNVFTYLSLPVLSVSDKQDEETNKSNIQKYKTKECLILLTCSCFFSDFQADFVIQFDPPKNKEAFLEIVKKFDTKVIQFVVDEESKFLEIIKEKNVELKQFTFHNSKVVDIQNQLNKLIEKNYFFNRMAFDAYKSYLFFYSKHEEPEIFNIQNLIISKVGKSYGFSVPPRINLNVKFLKKQ